jgi:stage V sporulation protein B
MLLPSGLEYAAAGASLGAFAGAVAGFIVLLYYDRKLEHEIAEEVASQKQKAGDAKGDSCEKIIKRIFWLALPVSASSLMLPLVANLDLMIVPMRLEVAGFTVAEATEYFGYLTGMAVPLTNLATILTAALAVSLVPAISEAKALGDKVRIMFRTGAAMRITTIITFPAFILVFMLHTEISTLIYNAPLAGPVVGYLATAIVFLGIHQVTTGILQGLGHTTVPLVNMAVAAVAKVGLNWVLTAIPALGILGATLATTVYMGLAAVMNLYFIHRYIGYRISLTESVKTAVAAFVMAVSIYAVYNALAVTPDSTAVMTVVSALAGSLVYTGVLFMLGMIRREDVAGVPYVGDKLTRLFCRIGVF